MGILGDYRGTATVTVTADDGNGGTVSDTFTVPVKAAPVVASALADVTSLEAEAEQTVLLPGVFSDADGDALTISAASSNTAAATVSVTSDYDVDSYIEGKSEFISDIISSAAGP